MVTSPSARAKIASGPSRHVYDVIVLGSQVGGALAGALLAKRGYRVLLVEHDGMGAGYEHAGYLLPYAPFIAPGLKSMPAVEEAFTELGLTTSVQRALKPHKPELQLVLPRNRIDLHADEARRTAELSRELGERGVAFKTSLQQLASQHEATDAFFRESPPLPPDGFLENWSLQKRIKQFPALDTAPLLMEDASPAPLLRSLLPFLGNLETPASPLAQTRPLSQALQSPHRYPGGREGLREMLCKRLGELGGDLLSRETTDSFVVEQVSFDGAKFEGVKVIRSENMYRGACLIAATDAGALRRLILDKKKHRALNEHLDGSSTRSFLFTVNWVLPQDALPRGMGELLLYDTQDAELGPLLVQLHPARTETGKEDPNLTVVCAGGFIPSTARELGEEHLKKIAVRYDEKLSELMPFSASQRLLRSAPYLDAGGVRGSRLLPHPLYAFEEETVLGITGLAQRTPVKNLFLASREVLPGLGLEGDLLSGMRAVKLVQETLKKHDPLK